MHALAYRAAGVRVVGVFDPGALQASALATMIGARALPTADALFAMDAEMASLCSPPPMHVCQAQSASRPGRTVLVEKPLATNASELQRVAQLDRCVPVLQWRAGRALLAVRAAILSGEFGETPSVCGDLSWSRDDAYFAAGRATSREWGCGVLLSVGIHAVDAVCFALARPLTQALGSLSYRRGMEVETSAVMTMAFDGGALACLRATFDADADTTRLSFAGGGASAVIEGSELDPTAANVTWSAPSKARLRFLEALESQSAGARNPPLLVPFLHAAIDAVKRGALPGDCDALPSVASAWAAHDAVFEVYAEAARQATARLT
jgi:predicted dehydrogenase